MTKIGPEYQQKLKIMISKSDILLHRILSFMASAVLITISTIIAIGIIVIIDDVHTNYDGYLYYGNGGFFDDGHDFYFMIFFFCALVYLGMRHFVSMKNVVISDLHLYSPNKNDAEIVSENPKQELPQEVKLETVLTYLDDKIDDKLETVFTYLDDCSCLDQTEKKFFVEPDKS